MGDRSPDGPIASVAVAATARHAAARIAAAGGPRPEGALAIPSDIRDARRQERVAGLIVLAVDASGSMGAPQRMEAVKGAILGLLTDAYRCRDLVGLVSFRGEQADVLLRPTGSVEVARARLAELPNGGRTPLAAGIAAALKLATAPARAATHHPRLVLVTDGRATAGPAGADPVEAAGAAADAVRLAGVDAVVIDVEATGAQLGPAQYGEAQYGEAQYGEAQYGEAQYGEARLGLARPLAPRMGARYVALASVDSSGLRGAIGWR